MIASALAAPPANNFGTSVKFGRHGRQVENFNGQAVKNGAKVRKVLRKGRQFLPGLAVPGPVLQPIQQQFRAAPLQFAAPAPAPLQFAAPAPLQFAAPAPLQFAARTPLQFNAPPPVQFAPAPLQFAAPAPLPPAPTTFVVRQQNLPAAPERSVAPTLEYGAPATVAPEVRAPAGGYGAPAEEIVELRDSYLPSEPEIVEVVELRDSYLSSGPEAAQFAAAPSQPEVIAVRDSYSAASDDVVELRDSYSAAQPAVVAVRAEPTYSVPRTIANVKSNIALAKPIAIVRSTYNPPAETSVFDYSFESENGIKQEATGVMKTVDDNEVSVMSGSYSYIGADGLDYLVEWYADETGFHATAPHLPQSVVPDHPEVAAAVRAQIAFAAEQDAAAAASGRSTSYAAPGDDLGQYNPRDDLGQYDALASYN